jgi:hypothetical protein
MKKTGGPTHFVVTPNIKKTAFNKMYFDKRGALILRLCHANKHTQDKL